MNIAPPGLRAGIVTALATLVTFALCSSTPSEAATVEVHLKDSSGVTLAGLSVGLFPTEAPQHTTPGFDYRYPKSLTDGSGVAVMREVPVGTWVVYVAVPSGRDFLRFEIPGFSESSPWSDPQVPAPRLTVSRADETLAVDVTLQKGDRIVCQLVVDQDAKAWGQVHFEEIATKVRFETYLRNGDGRRLLPPGRWRVWLEPRPGQLLRDFEVDHEPVMGGASAVIETKGEARRIDLYWHYVAPCKVTGRLAWDVGENPPGTVVAHLVRAGGWVEDVERRGGTITDKIPAALDNGFYTLFLLDGAWRLTVEGPRVVSSQPDHLDLELAPGDESSADFFVKAKMLDDSEHAVLFVAVKAPDGRRLGEAHVAIWPLREGEEVVEKKEPLMRAETDKDGYPTARFVGIPAGNYRIVAGHRDYREGRTTFEGFMAKPGSAQEATVVLERGAEIAASAKDENGTPARGIELRVDRKGDAAPSELGDEELDKIRAKRSAVTDETGWLKIGGLDPGTYRLEAALTEQRKGTHFVRIEGVDPPAAAKETSLTENEKKDVALRLVPAASVTARLACSDRGSFPEKTSVGVVPASVAERDEETVWRKEAAFARDDLLLSGRDLDHLFVGPLPEGVYTMVVRPQGFDRWTFTPGTEESARAVPMVLDAGKIEDLGVVELDCGPTVRVEPEIQTLEAMPDLHDAVLTVDAKRLPDAPKGAASPNFAPTKAVSPEAARADNPVAQPAIDEGARGEGRRAQDPEPLPAPRQEIRDAFIRLRGLPEAKVSLALTITHPYFVPSTITVDPSDYLLERGREARARVVVPRLGGAIQLETSLGGSVAVLTSSAGDGPVRYPLDPKARAVGITPGRYSVEVFSDPEATHRLVVWKDVVVEAARTVRLR